MMSETKWSLTDSRTFKQKKHEKKKHEILALKSLLQEIRLKNLMIRKIF